MPPSILLCSDLDRTLLPNGTAPESPQARRRLRAVAARPELMLVYVSGRHEALLRRAISDYDLPVPDYAVGDVGTSIYEIHGGDWSPLPEWTEHIASDWACADRGDLAALFADLDSLHLQESEKQNTFKLSYYTSSDVARNDLLAEMRSRLQGIGVKASLIWSVDEAADTGLLDVLPASATKLHAVEFLMARSGLDVTRTVFAGDSGNDLPVVTSGRLQAVLVRNAHSDVMNEASRSLRKLGLEERLYVARGGFHGMNGNYSAGVLEGLAYFLPETESWM